MWFFFASNVLWARFKSLIPSGGFRGKWSMTHCLDKFCFSIGVIGKPLTPYLGDVTTQEGNWFSFLALLVSTLWLFMVTH